MYDKLYNAIIANDCDIAVCNSRKDSNVFGISETKSNFYKDFDVYTIYGNVNNLINILSYNNSAVWNKLYKRELFDFVRFPEDEIYEDIQTTYKLVYKSNKIVYINDVLYNYVIRKNSITSTNNINTHVSFIKSFKIQYDDVKDINPILKMLSQKLFTESVIHILKSYDDMSKHPNEKEIIKSFLKDTRISRTVKKSDYIQFEKLGILDINEFI